MVPCSLTFAGHMLSEPLSQGLVALLPSHLCLGAFVRLNSQGLFPWDFVASGPISAVTLTFPQPQPP